MRSIDACDFFIVSNSTAADGPKFRDAKRESCSAFATVTVRLSRIPCLRLSRIPRLLQGTTRREGYRVDANGGVVRNVQAVV